MMSTINDSEIVQLFWERNELAIDAAAKKYSRYCAAVAGNILNNEEEIEECLNDTYYKAWQSIPPHKPNNLCTFLGKITRNLCVDRYRRSRRSKRGGGELELALDEMSEVADGENSVEGELERKELIEAINEFLAGLSENKRDIFVCRYSYFDSVQSIAERFDMTENAVSVTLNRIRARLKVFLEKRGFDI